MTKNVLVFLGHPNKDSFDGALAEAYAQGARSAGANVKVMKIGDIKFDPILWKGYNIIQELEPDLKEAQNNIKWAHHIVFVYPTWWSTMPALFKGFFDRIWLPGFAFHYENGNLRPKKKLTNRSAHLIFTMDSPPWYYGLFMHAPGHTMMKKGLLHFSGIRPVRTTEIGSIKTSSKEKRQHWLEMVNRLGSKLK